MKYIWPAAATAILVTACGGGGGGGGGNTGGDSGTGGGSSTWTPNSFLPAESFAAQCTNPRSGTDPTTGLPYTDVQGSSLTENNWLRSWSNDLYLWYDEIVDRDPGLYATPDYFSLLKTFASTPSGTPKDKFHFSIPTDEWLMLAQSGVGVGYGADWSVISNVPPRQIVVAYTEPGSPADAAPASLARGATVLAIDGVDIDANDSAGIDVLNAGLYPAEAGETHTFTIRDLGASTSREVILEAVNVTSVPVQNVQTIDDASGFGPVGYVLFNSHIITAEQPLIDAFAKFENDGVTDLVLDLRYNSGGFLVLASEVAYMIAGAVPTAGQTFEEQRFNDKHPSTDPVTGEAIEPMPFLTTAILSSSAGDPLPTLDLPRVFVLTGPTTCSASESIINGLQGVDVEVIQIGTTTCGKPYGFYAADNCGTTYFSIEFKGVNAKDFGDYTDGFVPGSGAGSSGTPTEGCPVADDFTHALGDPAEARFSAALSYREMQTCPTAALATAGASKPSQPLIGVDGRVYKSPWLENRILGTP